MTETTINLPALPETDDLPALYGHDRHADLEQVLADIEATARAHEPDMSTVTSRARTASLAHTIARSKTALDDAGKTLNSGLREQINRVDASRRGVRDRMDALKAEILEPVVKWRSGEKLRVDRLDAMVGDLIGLGEIAATSQHLPTLEGSLESAAGTVVDATWQERETDGHRARSAAIDALTAAVERASQRAAELADLARLRAEQEERDRLTAEALMAERAKIAEQEREARELLIAAEAEARAERAAQARIDAAAEAQAEAERKWKADMEAAEKRARDAEIEAERREIAAAEAERQRQINEAEAEQRAAEKREANREHRAKVKAEVTEALARVLIKDGIVDEVTEAAMISLFDALVAGEIPYVRVKF